MQPTFMQAYNNKQEQLDKISGSIMEAQFPEVRQVYIDLNCLKDTRLGTLLAYAPDRETKSYLIENIDAYNKRVKRDFTSAYKDYPLSELELEMKYRDHGESEKIFNKSPDTDFCLHLFDYLRILMQQNSRAGYMGQVKIFINVYPLAITPFMKMWIKAVKSCIEGYAFVAMTESHSNIQASFWGGTQIAIIDNILPCLQQDAGIYQPLFVDGTLRNMEIFAAYQIDPAIYEKLQDIGITETDGVSTLDDMFTLTQMVMSVCCKFQYMHFIIPKP